MHRYPLAAIVGQEKLKAAYLASIVNPNIGGLLISGPKGTGKSSIVYSSESILPSYMAVERCIFRCDPTRPHQFCVYCREAVEHHPVERAMKIVALPLSCTEDRLIGSINVEKLLKEGVREVQSGILGEANRNILYIDEVNLLPDHLVDDILDSAASHWNAIEREGISISHPSAFILIGTMNPEEGDLRPQILDRFPLCVKVGTITDPLQRAEIVRRNLEFEADPEKFVDRFLDQTSQLKRQIADARELLPRVAISDELIILVASVCHDLKVDGQRPDIIIVKTGKTLAALDSRTETRLEDVMLAAELTLIHRTRDGGLLEPPTVEAIQEAFAGRSPPAQGALKKNAIRS